MPDVLNVERERVLQESRRQNNVRPTSREVLDIEGEKRSKLKFATNEARLQALAAAEKARRAEGRPPTKAAPAAQRRMQAPPKPVVSKPVVPKPAPAGGPAEQITKPKAPEQPACQVVKVHADGSFDLRLSSGEIVERVDKSWHARLQMPADAVAASPPPSASGQRPGTGLSRPGTGGVARPGTGQSRPGTAASQAGPALAPDAGKQGVHFVDLTDAAPSAGDVRGGATASAGAVPPAVDLKDVPAPVVNLDDTLSAMGRRGGRGSLGARRAAQSEMLSALSWE